MPKTQSKAPAPTDGAKRPRVSIKTTIFSLNTDCLAEIFTYLPLEDAFIVHQTDPRFKEAAHLRFSQGGVDRTDAAFLSSAPKEIIGEFIDNFGLTCKSMKFKLLPSDVFLPLIARFSQLKELVLSEIDMEDLPGASESFPVGLETLEIDRCVISGGIMSKWIPKLSDTLIELRVICQEDIDISALPALNKLQTVLFDCNAWTYAKVIAELCANNKDHMNSLTILYDKSIHQDIWKEIIAMDQLTRFQSNSTYRESTIPSEGPFLPRLKSLVINSVTPNMKTLLNGLACPGSLEYLSIESYSHHNYPNSDLKRFTHLRHLELIEADWTNFPLEFFGGLKQLQHLNLNMGEFNDISEVFGLLSDVGPRLSKLSLEWLMIWFPKNPDCDKLERKFQRMAKKYKNLVECSFTISEP